MDACIGFVAIRHLVDVNPAAYCDDPSNDHAVPSVTPDGFKGGQQLVDQILHSQILRLMEREARKSSAV